MVAAARSLTISRHADKFIKSLPEKQRKAVKESVSRLITDGFADLDIRRLLPYPHEFRLRVGKVREHRKNNLPILRLNNNIP
ncbi:MAG: hypothetical protein BWK80_58420 [Desulfobacteraceae bacterium IS3]|jgi:mRNA-degrading endonuclease RelE of RelBE toxin-antitoxin system|nr:MAG: hypothetical protein BWK80_58420 [Desulfobacteraceae bacterium IS3]